MELNLFVKELFSKAQEEGFSEYEVYYVDRESLSISVYKEEVEKYNLNNSAVYHLEENLAIELDILILKY